MYRVVLVHPSAGVNWSGGTENFAIELTDRLSAYFDVELLAGAPCSPHYYPAGGIPRTQAIDLIKLPVMETLLKKISTHPHIVVEHLTSFMPCAIRLLKKPADLIFPCNDYGGLAVAALVRSLIGTPILFKAATGLNKSGKSLQRCLRFKPDSVVVFSSIMENFVKNQDSQIPTNIIPNGVDLNIFSPQGDRFENDLNSPLILCVASLNRRDHKRVELAIRAVAKLPHASLLVCGDGPERAYFQEFGKKLLGEKRFAIITVPFKQMPSVYRSANVFTLPSLDEPFGQAYIQAMACGLPVIATEDQMRRNIVANAGILCDVTDIDSYADAISRGLNQSWQIVAQNNAKRFSWDIIVQQYRDLIIETIEGSRKANKQTVS